MRRFFTMIGLGFGLALGGGLAYALITDETARLFVFTFGAFILGAIIVGMAIIVANRVLIHGLFGRPDRESTTVNYRLPRPAEQALGYPPWWAQQQLPAPPAASWPAFPSAPGPASQVGYAGFQDVAPGDADDEYVA